MPYTACPRERRCSEPPSLVKAKAQLSAGHRCCPLLSPRLCPQMCPRYLRCTRLRRLVPEFDPDEAQLGRKLPGAEVTVQGPVARRPDRHSAGHSSKVPRWRRQRTSPRSPPRRQLARSHGLPVALLFRYGCCAAQCSVELPSQLLNDRVGILDQALVGDPHRLPVVVLGKGWALPADTQHQPP
jgi:hypothetical protein